MEANIQMKNQKCHASGGKPSGTFEKKYASKDMRK